MTAKKVVLQGRRHGFRVVPYAVHEAKGVRTSATITVRNGRFCRACRGPKAIRDRAGLRRRDRRGDGS